MDTPAARDVMAERNRQDAQWGGPEHDDCHSPGEWLQYIDHQKSLALKKDDAEYRSRMVKIAALALAAIDSNDRKHRK